MLSMCSRGNSSNPNKLNNNSSRSLTFKRLKWWRRTTKLKRMLRLPDSFSFFKRCLTKKRLRREGRGGSRRGSRLGCSASLGSKACGSNRKLKIKKLNNKKKNRKRKAHLNFSLHSLLRMRETKNFLNIWYRSFLKSRRY